MHGVGGRRLPCLHPAAAGCRLRTDLKHREWMEAMESRTAAHDAALYRYGDGRWRAVADVATPKAFLCSACHPQNTHGRQVSGGRQQGLNEWGRPERGSEKAQRKAEQPPARRLCVGKACNTYRVRACLACLSGRLHMQPRS